MLECAARTLGDSNPDTFSAMNHLSLVLLDQAKLNEAEQLDREELESYPPQRGQRFARALTAAENLGIVLCAKTASRMPRALDRENVAIRRRVLGPTTLKPSQHEQSRRVLKTKASSKRRSRSGSRSSPLDTRILGPEHQRTLSAIANLAEILTRRGDYARASSF